MPQLTEEDFHPVYMNVRKHGADDSTWPKLVLWALDAPLVYGNMQVMVTVLQKQSEPYGEWSYTASVKPNDHTVSTDEENLYGQDQYAEIGTIGVGPNASFAECLQGAYEAIVELNEE